MTMATPRFADTAHGPSPMVRVVGRDDDAPMPITSAIVPTIVRCECTTCGAHVEVRASWQIAGWCRNCHGYDLRPLGLPHAA